MPVKYTRRALLSLSVLVACALGAVQAQILDPVKWTFATETGDDGETYIVFSAAIDEGWSVYSQYLDSDDGPVATEIVYDNPEAATLTGRAEEMGDKQEGFDGLFDMNVVKFKRDYTIRQRVRFAGVEPLAGYLTFMTCDDEKCLPPTDVDFSFAAPARREPATGAAPKVEEKNLKTAEPTAPAIVQAVEEAVAAEQTPDPPATSVRPRMLEPVTWTVATRRVDGDLYAISWTAAIAEGWTVYSQEVEEGGPVPTTFAFDESAGVELVGEVSERGRKKSGIDPSFGVRVTKFLAPSATWTQQVRLSDPSAALMGYLEFMSCDAEMCLPPEEQYWRFSPGEGSATLLDYATYETLASAEASGAVATTGGDSDEPGPTSSPTGDANATYTINKDNEATTCGETVREVTVDAKAGLFAVFFLGFGGGLLALLTPCVFPMIPLTVSFFTGRGKNRKKGLQRALLYGASIIAIYVTLGLVITGVFGADALNLLSTNAWFNIAFGVLFIIFALSFFGFYEITLPSSWANKSDRAADQGGLLGIFFMAFTLSLVSFSCTGPIIGTLLVETATGGGATIFGRVPVAPLVGMLGFSSALALPFTLFAAFPSALESLPKSGGWMNTVKVTLGFAELALAMKFLSTADLIMGTKWMPYELFIAVWVLCAAGLGAYYFGWLKTPLEKYGAQKVSNITLGLGTLALLFAVYVGLGYRYDEQATTFDTPALLSGLAPPPGHSYIYDNDCPQNLNCFKDYDEAMAFAKTADKPILVDFTGHGCVNCRKMEDNVWDKPGVYDRIRDDYVLVSLYVDEREALEEPFTSDFSGRKIRTVGNKWADFQARYFDRNSQPYYVLMSPEGEVLNQPVAYTPDVDQYAAFLECGLQQFERLRDGKDVVPGAVGMK